MPLATRIAWLKQTSILSRLHADTYSAKTHHRTRSKSRRNQSETLPSSMSNVGWLPQHTSITGNASSHDPDNAPDQYQGCLNAPDSAPLLHAHVTSHDLPGCSGRHAPPADALPGDAPVRCDLAQTCYSKRVRDSPGRTHRTRRHDPLLGQHGNRRCYDRQDR